MDPINTSQAFPEENQPLTCCKVSTGIVATVSAAATVIFSISTYFIMTYGAPLAFVAVVANPFVTAGIAAAAALTFIIALSILCSAPSEVIEKSVIPKTILSSAPTEVMDKSVLLKNSELNCESEVKISKNKPLPSIQKPTEENLRAILSRFTERTPENEIIEAFDKVPVSQIQKYIEKKEYSYLGDELFFIPPMFLSQLDLSKFTDKEVYLLCFGVDQEYKLAQLKIQNLQKFQIRFGELIGCNENQLKRFDKPIVLPYFSAAQLRFERSSFEGDFNPNFYGWGQFFPQYKKPTDLIIKSERERFANLFDSQNVRFMLEKGGALELPSDFFDNYGLPNDSVHNKWKYSLQLIPSDYIRFLDFSFIKTENEHCLRFDPFQIIFMVQDFTDAQVQALSTEQKNQIKETLELTLKGKDERSKQIQKYLEFQSNWHNYNYSLERIKT
ncbi:MAG: hypothetical protein H0T62_05220 [Parachlamydiaceae bacterium]|nr:hypothetical protein [Parachlamydiaceae bacterium]